MNNEKEIEIIAKFIETEQPISWRFKFSRNIDDMDNDPDVEIMSEYTAENFVNAGIGDKKQAVALTDAPARRTEEERRIRKEEREKTIDELLTLANINIPPTVTNAQDYVDGFLYFFNMIKSLRDKVDGGL